MKKIIQALLMVLVLFVLLGTAQSYYTFMG